MSNLFIEEKYNALYQALEECAEDDDYPAEVWLSNTRDEIIIKLLVDKLEELGYIIVKK